MTTRTKTTTKQSSKPTSRAATKKTKTAGPAAAPERQTKKSIVIALLGRPEGASLDELVDATGWQPHSTRAVLTGFRKSGKPLDRFKDDAGGSRYRMAAGK